MEIHLVLRISTATNKKKDAGELVEQMVLKFLMVRVAGMEPQLRMEKQKLAQSTLSPKLKQ